MARKPRPSAAARKSGRSAGRHGHGGPDDPRPENTARAGSPVRPASGPDPARKFPHEAPPRRPPTGGAQPGTLFVVATPIGNLEDITLRALSTLRSVALIVCEDTRRTRTLLDHHGIAGTLIPYHKFNERTASSRIVRKLLEGNSVALVSDGGTPAISDPGYRLVRDALDAGAEVTPIPGPSALAAAVSASGLPSECVTFRGFLPRRAGERRRLLQSIRSESATQVFFEAPHRIVPSLLDLAEALGPRRAAVAREMTKRFETWVRGPLSEVAARVAQGTLKGEFCIVVEGAGRHQVVPASGAAGLVPEGSDPVTGTLSGFHTARIRTRPRTGPGAGSPVAPPGCRDAPAAGSGLGTSGSKGPEGDGFPRDAGQDSAAVAAALEALYERGLASGLDRREALRRAAAACGLTRKDAYRRLKAVPKTRQN